MTPPDSALLEIFTAEQAEHVLRMRVLVAQLGAAETDPSTLEELLRRAHTLKGAARAAGFEPTELITHTLEGLFAALRAGKMALTPDLQPLFFRAFDAIEDILAAVRSKRPLPDTANLVAEIARKGAAAGAPAHSSAPETSPAAESAPEPLPQGEFVRLNASYLDDLMGASSELIASTADGSGAMVTEEDPIAETALHELAHLRQQTSSYFRGRQHDPEFEPVIQSFQRAERQIQLLAAGLRTQAANRHRREWEFHRLAMRLEESAFRVRMVSADTIFGNFGPMLRNLALEQGKQVEFHAEGLELPVDRLVLQALKDPLMHLLRNAVSHGIEPEHRRIAAGKPAAGTISLTIRARGSRLLVTVRDDGPGLNRRALAEEASRLGIVPEGDAAAKADTLADLVFRPGFSTSSSLTRLSGRGMGLAVVRHEVSRLHGDVRISSQAGKGTTVSISVPISVSSQQVLLVAVAEHVFGIPVSFVERLCRVSRSEIQTFDGRPAVLVDFKPVGLARLSGLLDLPSATAEDREEVIQAVILAAGGNTAAVAVDRLLDVRDSVIKPLGIEPENAGLGSGAVALSDGTAAVILNVADLLDRFGEAGGTRVATFTPAAPQTRKHEILIVDDSLTTRSLEKSLLEANGYDVRVAVDGVEALEKLRAGPTDLVITDLMMPRMDGFQLLEQIRRDKSLAKTPVVIVSSMESREDQERGLALGADAYIVKRRFDQRELLDIVRQIL